MKRAQVWPGLGLLLVLVVVAWRLIFVPTYGAQLGERAMQLNNNQVSSATDYRLTFQLSSPGVIGSISVLFCANDPLPETVCVPPTGFDAGPAVLDNQTGPGDFTIAPASTANNIILTRSPAMAAVGAASFHFTDVINPSAPGGYYARVLTYVTDDASGPYSDHGGIAFAINDDVSVSSTVPPYLIFCTGTTIGGLNCANASGDFIDFGELSPSKAASGSSQMMVSTNAEVGYNITVNGTTLTSGNNVITALIANDVSRPGTPQFGLNLRANSSPPAGADPTGPGTGAPAAGYNLPNSYRFINGDVVASKTFTEDTRKYTASYIANVPSSQAAGIYVTTLTYVCLANF